MIFFFVIIVNTKMVATEHSYRLLQCCDLQFRLFDPYIFLTGGYCDPRLKFMSVALVCSLSATPLPRLLDK